jgi:hypothetical protein
VTAAEPGAERLPAPTFAMLVSNFATQAMMELGEIENPISGRKERAPNRAKFTIDMLELLREKTAGNLAAEEQRFIDAALYELRLRYVAIVKGS